MKKTFTVMFLMCAMARAGDDKPNPAYQASEQVPPDCVLGKTYDGGPMKWDWETIKSIFKRKEKK